MKDVRAPAICCDSALNGLRRHRQLAERGDDLPRGLGESGQVVPGPGQDLVEHPGLGHLGDGPGRRLRHLVPHAGDPGQAPLQDGDRRPAERRDRLVKSLEQPVLDGQLHVPPGRSQPLHRPHKALRVRRELGHGLVKLGGLPGRRLLRVRDRRRGVRHRPLRIRDLPRTVRPRLVHPALRLTQSTLRVRDLLRRVDLGTTLLLTRPGQRTRPVLHLTLRIGDPLLRLLDLVRALDARLVGLGGVLAQLLGLQALVLDGLRRLVVGELQLGDVLRPVARLGLRRPQRLLRIGHRDDGLALLQPAVGELVVEVLDLPRRVPPRLREIRLDLPRVLLGLGQLPDRVLHLALGVGLIPRRISDGAGETAFGVFHRPQRVLHLLGRLHPRIRQRPLRVGQPTLRRLHRAGGRGGRGRLRRAVGEAGLEGVADPGESELEGTGGGPGRGEGRGQQRGRRGRGIEVRGDGDTGQCADALEADAESLSEGSGAGPARVRGAGVDRSGPVALELRANGHVAASDEDTTGTCHDPPPIRGLWRGLRRRPVPVARRRCRGGRRTGSLDCSCASRRPAGGSAQADATFWSSSGRREA
ncbi:hypothetical protein [Streptomyces sp. NPDC048392]|uniref:hypothetical protein n=1 Tax=Streptomyces sp. NPDC048392 TaxID=3365543 RepID=UPI003716739A